MATHSSIIAWRIPWAEEPGGLQLHRVAKSQTQLSKWPKLIYSSAWGQSSPLEIYSVDLR